MRRCTVCFPGSEDGVVSIWRIISPHKQQAIQNPAKCLGVICGLLDENASLRDLAWCVRRGLADVHLNVGDTFHLYGLCAC